MADEKGENWRSVGMSACKSFLDGKMKMLGMGAGAIVLVLVGWQVFKYLAADVYDTVVPDMPKICWMSAEKDCGTWAYPNRWFSGEDKPKPTETKAVATAPVMTREDVGLTEEDNTCEHRRAWYNPKGLLQRCADN